MKRIGKPIPGAIIIQLEPDQGHPCGQRARADYAQSTNIARANVATSARRSTLRGSNSNIFPSVRPNRPATRASAIDAIVDLMPETAACTRRTSAIAGIRWALNGGAENIRFPDAQRAPTTTTYQVVCSA